MKLINKTPTTDRPYGDNGDEITSKLNYNIMMSNIADSVLGQVKIFAMGDSMMGYGGSAGSAGFMGMMRMISYDADVHYNDGSYYDNATDAAYTSGGPRGFNFAAGGTNTAHLVNVQMKFVREAFNKGTLPPLFIMSTFQNNQFWSPDHIRPEAVCLQVISALEELTGTMGRRGILLGPWPHSRLAADSTGKHYIEHRMKDYCRRNPGVVYVSILDALKTGDATEESADNVNFLGWQLQGGQVGRASWDEIHSAPYGARIVAQLLGPAFRKLVGECEFPIFEASDFDAVKNPWGNLFGKQGRLLGSGGTIVNVADPNNYVRTATNNLPLGVELVYDQSKGVTITPSLTGNPRRPLRLVASGTPTADIQWRLRLFKQIDLTGPVMEVRGEAWWVNQQGWGGIGLGNAHQGAPGIPNSEIISSYPGHGGGGGADYVMPYPLNERLNFHGAPFVYNHGNRMMKMDLGGGFATGIVPSGALDVGFLGMFKTSAPTYNL